MHHITADIVELFKRKDFDVITDHDGKAFVKQKEALHYLTDNVTTECIFGGGAGGSKSFTGWSWVTLMSLAYPGTHYFVARETLKDVRVYGMQSFNEVSDFLWLTSGKDYKINNQDSIIQFANGSKIYMLECKKKPSDKDFHGLGSSLFTSGFIEEGGEVHFDAYDTLCSRVNRWKNEKYNILGKIFVTCNPAHNWLYTEFYLKDKNGSLPYNQKFLPALAKDNPYCPIEYIERLSRLKDPKKRARLYLGDWEYDDDPTVLIDYTTINDMFTNSHIQRTGKMYIIADVARFGSDKAVITVWDGLTIIYIISFDRSKTTQVQEAIRLLSIKFQVPKSRILVDADGVGGGVVDNLGVLGFNNEGKTTDDGYRRIKDECGYKLAELAPYIFIDVDLAPETEELIRVELGQLKTFDTDKDTKLRILPKDKIKVNIGHSPDYLDCFIMRMWFELDTAFTMVGGTHNRDRQR